MMRDRTCTAYYECLLTEYVCSITALNANAASISFAEE